MQSVRTHMARSLPVRTADRRAEVLRAVNLVQALVVREFKGRYRRSLLGPAWAMIQPLAYLMTFTLVGHILNIESEGAPYVIFTYSALVPWTFFSTAVSRCGPSIYFKGALIRKIALPREVFPIAEVVGSLVDCLIAALILAVLMVWFRMPIGWAVLWFPVLLLLVILLATGVGFAVAALGTYQFDTVFALPFLMQFGMFATPVMYPLYSVPAAWRGWYALNPMVGIVDGFRAILVQARPPDLSLLGYSTIGFVIVWIIAWPLFRFTSQYFADVL
jgi:lipopolysaccharide transport system permease protein